ncbi:MAG: hypothetical protein FJ035_05295 [Chloroflexi bacterium]|nr:hypothetical protein [Chloroflexota bacterium]
MRRSLPLLTVWLVLAGGPALAFAWLHANDAPDHALMAPATHFYIVSVTAVLSAALALVMMLGARAGAPPSGVALLETY